MAYEGRAAVRHNKPAHLWLDQYGNHFWAHTLKELRAQISGRVSIMYCDKLDGRTVKTGYVIGQHWLSRFAPVELAA